MSAFREMTAAEPLKYRDMKFIKLLCRFSILDLQITLQQGYHDVGLRLEQMNRFHEALHDVHHEFAIGRYQFARAREYRRRTELGMGNAFQP